MVFAALVSITLAPALMALLIRGRIRHEKEHPVSRAHDRACTSRSCAWRSRTRRRRSRSGSRRCSRPCPMAMRLGNEFMPPLNEGDLLYMPTTFPNISIEEAKRQLQVQDRLIRCSSPRWRRCSARRAAPRRRPIRRRSRWSRRVVQLRPRDQWRMRRAPALVLGLGARMARAGVPAALARRRRITLGGADRPRSTATMQCPGWTNAWTMPIKTRIDMLSTGHPHPDRHQGLRRQTSTRSSGSAWRWSDIDVAGAATRAACTPTATPGGFYIDIIPDREALARYGLALGDVQDVIESAIGGQPIGVTVEGRNRFTINVRYPRDLRSDVERLRHVLVPLHGTAGPSQSPGMGGMSADPAPAGILLASAGLTDTGEDFFAQAMGGPRMERTAASGARGSARRPHRGLRRHGRRGTGKRTSAGTLGSGRHRPWPEPSGPTSRSGQLADIRVVDRPAHDPRRGRLLVGYVYVDMDAAPAGHRRLRGRARSGPWRRTGVCGCRRLLPQVDRPVRAAGADAARA